jgi:catechol 2,3-dioxygenase-like lactoylglutathione lyase family enzyme
MDEALRLWAGVLGFVPAVDVVIPAPDAGLFSPAELDDIFEVQGATSRMVMLRSDAGALVELQQPGVPAVRRNDPAAVGYATTGLTEVALDVTDIDTWFEKIRDAGYKTQTDYVWSLRDGWLRSFLFSDADGTLIQFCEQRD